MSSGMDLDNDAASSQYIINQMTINIDVQTVDDRFGRTAIESFSMGVLGSDFLDGGSNGLSPSFCTHKHASRKFLVNMVGSDLVRHNSFTWPAAKK